MWLSLLLLISPVANLPDAPSTPATPLLSHYQITPKVNVTTGEYIEDECDLVVAGSEPLSLRRFYGHNNPYTKAHGFWRFNPETSCIADFEYDKETFIAVGEFNGNVSCFPHRNGPAQFVCDLKKNPGFTHMEPTGRHHPLNLRVDYRKKDVKGDNFSWVGEIYDGKGGMRTFDSGPFEWLKSRRKRSHGECYTEHPNAWTPYYVTILEEKKPNGNILSYDYDYESTRAGYPKIVILKKITAYNSTKTKILGSLEFTYSTRDIKVKGSDGREVLFADNQRGRIGSVSTPDKPFVSYKGHHNFHEFLMELNYPDGRKFRTEYNENSKKVMYHEVPVGSNDEMVVVNSFVYHTGATEVRNVQGSKTFYRFDTDKRITSIDLFDGEKLYRKETFESDPFNCNLKTKSLTDSTGKFFLKHNYEYDARHNVKKETTSDEQSAYTTYRDFSNDGFNLLLREWDDFGKDVRYSYKPNTNLLASELTYNGGKIVKRLFHTYDDCAILIKTTLDDGNSTHAEDLHNVTFRKIKIITPRYEHPCFGLPATIEEKTIDETGSEVLLSKVDYSYHPSGKITEETHYDSNGVKRFTITNTYDDRERLESTTNPLGYRTEFKYDNNNNFTLIREIDAGKEKTISYNHVNKPIRIEEKTLDGTTLTSITNYDNCGRVKELINECNHKTTYSYDVFGRIIKETAPDGGVHTKEYDILDHVIKEIDALGNVTEKKYNFQGLVTEITHCDGVKEISGYFPNGLIEWHIDRNGAKTIYKYDALKHPIEQLTYDSEGVLLKKTSATWSGLHQLSSTNAGGVTTFYDYDLAGRKICERTLERVTNFSYDELGRMNEIEKDGVLTIQEFDLLNRVTMTRTELADGTLQLREEYKYDAAGNKTHLITSKGETLSTYNPQGLPISQTDPLGNTTTLSYSYANAFEKTITAPNGITTTTRYDFKGRELETKKKNQNILLQHSERKYDLLGNLIKELHHLIENGKELGTIVHDYEYIHGNRLKRKLEAGKKETLYLYDTYGRLATTIKPDKNELHHTYDDLGRLKRYYGSDFDYHYTYDALDRPLLIEDATSHTTTEKTYDDYGNLIREKNALELTISYEYDTWGRRKKCTLPDNTEIYYTYQGNTLYSITRDNLTHTYLKRDLEGLPTLISLPADLGLITIERDALNRIRTFTSPNYSSTFDNTSYDTVHNLLHYTFTDALGTQTENYSYDDLNQLTQDPAHTYSYDSLYNRRKKDDNPHTINSLCQVENDGTTSYTYDANGNLISDGHSTFTYDSQDRLIEITQNEQRTCYVYDCFHRRIGKKIYTSNSLTDGIYYYFDGNNEIGASEWGATIELRILGEGLGAEIGAAILLELNDRPYIPIHDHRGSLVTLIDAYTQNAIDTYRYTAFGEKTSGGTLSPWQFSSKRLDPETNFLFFGRRYYNPTLGRWITPDPAGRLDGPNLYAYVHNCPLNACDLYGLHRHNSDYRGGLWYDACRFLNWMWDGFRSRDDDYHRTPRYRDYDIGLERSREYSLGRPKFEGMEISFINGQGNIFDIAFDSSTYLSDTIGGMDIAGLYNPTHDFFYDSKKSFNMLCHNIMYEPSLRLHEQWDKQFERLGGKGYILQYCHSQGALHVRSALMTYPEDKRNRIMVVAIAPACYIPKELCLDVRHYVSKRDGVPLFDWKGKSACADNIIQLTPHKDAPWFDHSFQSPTYFEPIRRSFKDFYDTYISDAQ